LLLVSVVIAVYKHQRESTRRQNTLEQEFKSARELQRVLVPEGLPALPGFAVTSAYKPAQEVGGDFFQIIPLEDERAGSTLVVLGDVSGKGLKAAMAVSLIVGMIRALSDCAAGPGHLLEELNRRLHGRLHGGFATCIAFFIDRNGGCTLASAGHPSPFLNGAEVVLPGAFPLGLIRDTTYEEIPMSLKVNDHLAVYTDGLLEARKPSGELYGFDRLHSLFSADPSATEATEAAVDFGQDDDITVLIFTRLPLGEESSTQLSAPALAPA